MLVNDGNIIIGFYITVQLKVEKLHLKGKMLLLVVFLKLLISNSSKCILYI